MQTSTQFDMYFNWHARTLLPKQTTNLWWCTVITRPLLSIPLLSMFYLHYKFYNAYLRPQAGRSEDSTALILRERMTSMCHNISTSAAAAAKYQWNATELHEKRHQTAKLPRT